MTGLIWVSIRGRLEVDSLRYTPIDVNDEAVTKGRSEPLFIVRCQDSRQTFKDPRQTFFLREVGKGANCMSMEAWDVLCCKSSSK
jgi:hypothetical protein